MSRRRNYSQDTEAVMARFFEALDACLHHKLAKNITRFCRDHAIDRRHLSAQRKDMGKGYFEVGWLVPLVSMYGVSSRWLLTGRGPMFDPEAVSVSLKPQEPQVT